MQPMCWLIELTLKTVFHSILIADKTIDIKSWIISLSGHLCPQDEADIVYSIVKNKDFFNIYNHQTF